MGRRCFGCIMCSVCAASLYLRAVHLNANGMAYKGSHTFWDLFPIALLEAVWILLVPVEQLATYFPNKSAALTRMLQFVAILTIGLVYAFDVANASSAEQVVRT